MWEQEPDGRGRRQKGNLSDDSGASFEAASFGNKIRVAVASLQRVSQLMSARAQWCGHEKCRKSADEEGISVLFTVSA